jgi:hypothetical protein
MCWCAGIMIFQNLPYKVSRQLLIPRLAAAGTSFSRLPCEAWHGHMVTEHALEVEQPPLAR